MVDPFGLAALVVVAALGAVVMVAGWRGALPEIGSGHTAAADVTGEEQHAIENPLLRLALALGGFILALLITGWIAAAVYAAVGGFLLPTFILAKRRRRAAIARVEAIATWTESLRDTMAASAGMQQALHTSARVAPAPIRTEVRDLVVRLQHQSVTESLRRFAADVKHPLADMVVASLILATTRHAGSLQNVLGVTAKAARDTAAMWRQVESGRTRMYAQARMAGWITAAMMAFLLLTRRELLAPYDTVVGQMVLFVVLGVFVGGNYWIYRLAKPVDPRRVFANVERWSDLEGRVLQ